MNNSFRDAACEEVAVRCGDFTHYSVSNSAEHGEYVAGPAHHDGGDQGRHEARLETRDWMLQNQVNQISFNAMRAKAAAHSIEEVGARLRAMMPWIGANKLVDKGKK